MNQQNFHNLLILIPFSLLFAACASNGSDHPTHFWQETHAKTEREYRIDNDACHEQFGVEESTQMRAESPSFEAYRNCMVEKGYVLQSYL